MDNAVLRQIIADQKDELDSEASGLIISRREESLINLDSSLAQVVMGVRRSGKSTLCKNVLRKSGRRYAYINFDDERLAKAEADDLDRILENLYRVYGDFTILFIDEIQNINEWYLFVNRLLRQGLHLLITGSNSKLLSSELSTHLTGRNHPIEIFPFSFADYCELKGVRADSYSTKAVAFQKNAFDDFLKNGGFPEIVKGNEEPFSYISTLISNILENDIERRYKIRYKQAFENFAQHLLNNAPFEVNMKRLTADFGFRSVHTAENYFGYLQKAYLLLELHKYSSKSRIRITEGKAYAVDCAIMNNRKDAFSGDNLGWRLETVVYLELLKRYINRGFDIYYLKDRGAECDFVVCRGNEVVKCIQVSYDISDKKTLSRELKGLETAAAVTHCENLLLLTFDTTGQWQCSNGMNVDVRPVYEWALHPEED